MSSGAERSTAGWVVRAVVREAAVGTVVATGEVVALAAGFFVAAAVAGFRVAAVLVVAAAVTGFWVVAGFAVALGFVVPAFAVAAGDPMAVDRARVTLGFGFAAAWSGVLELVVGSGRVVGSAMRLA